MGFQSWLRGVFHQPPRPVPPPELLAGIGLGEFAAIGDEFCGIFRDRAGLGPRERVLDAGCGIGRMAIPLLRVLRRGSYEGFDIVRSSVEWCQQSIQPLHPRFRFQHVDVYNRFYNPAGTIAPTELRFPFEDREFDFVFLTSVFTHMFAPEVRHYLGEIARVLRPGGRVLATFFILDRLALDAVDRGKSSIGFHQAWEHGRIADPENPEMAVGYNPEWVTASIAASGLVLRDPILYGNWCERGEHVSYQDIVIADRR